MTAIEKAEEAMQDAIDGLDMLVSSENLDAELVSRNLQEALAALEAEKPAEDIWDASLKLRIKIIAHQEYTLGQFTNDVQSLAESYHAKQCAACLKSAWSEVQERQSKIAEILIENGRN